MTNLGVQNDVRVAFVELSLVGLVIGALLDDLQLLHTPDFKSRLLANALEAWVKHRRHPKRDFKLSSSCFITSAKIKKAKE